MSAKILLGLSLTCCLIAPITGYLGVQQWTNPTSVQQSLTTSLTVNCSIVQGVNSSASNVSQAITLYIYKSTMRNPNVYEDVAFITGLQDKVEKAFSFNASLTGHLAIDGKNSYLALRWDYPQFELTGNFKCELSGLTDNSHLDFVEAVNQVTDIKPDLLAALGAIQNHDARIAGLENAIGSMNLRLAAFQSTLFQTITSVDNGRKYLLSRPFLQNSALAESVCKLLGGYLVEYDLQEFEIMKGIFANASLAEPVLVGITDEFAEGMFVFRDHPKVTAPYLMWQKSPQQPDGGQAENCATLVPDELGQWWLNDVDCYSNNARVHFLCEVPTV